MSKDPEKQTDSPESVHEPSDQTADSTFAPLCAQIEFFERAAAFRGWPRERLIALGEAEEIYFRLFPHHYRALQTIRVASQLGKMIGEHQDPASHCESRLLAIIMRILKEAIRENDLRLRDGQSPGEIAFTVWALTFGTRALMDTRVTRHQLGVSDGFRTSRDMTELLLDSLGWRPLGSEWDYARTRQRVREELLAQEWDELISRSQSRSAQQT